ncbi:MULTISPECIES: class I SAM-dependent methyltransferase [unclassified Aureimonas]|uniref:class I SAM-dependent methyltransferase n=1 Tax=unclassified Aureimonas TaxID=2615206 RepID=UPI000701C94E|nr:MULTISPECIES: rRNA adenine N-6-methyltransferase family protein [unclassified Aureimonas]KQT64418.1 phospholipid methyltransferase [Aureimonas sp. Leaf427]KQT81608.1 phospholipid methyltransferase [Aureimonas sp. Leaf460]
MSALPSRRLADDPCNRSKDDARFFRGWLKRPFVTGAVSPSSRALGRAMARFVPDAAIERGEVVLELGPGTGVVTQMLIERGVREESLVLIEYSAEFCRLLRARFPKATIVEGDAYALEAEAALAGRRIGTVVSSLPLFTKPDAMREALIGKALASVAPGHPFIQFSYALTLPVKPERLGAVVELSPWVKLNLPPARVIVYRRPA